MRTLGFDDPQDEGSAAEARMAESGQNALDARFERDRR